MPPPGGPPASCSDDAANAHHHAGLLHRRVTPRHRIGRHAPCRRPVWPCMTPRAASPMPAGPAGPRRLMHSHCAVTVTITVTVPVNNTRRVRAPGPRLASPGEHPAAETSPAEARGVGGRSSPSGRCHAHWPASVSAAVLSTQGDRRVPSRPILSGRPTPCRPGLRPAPPFTPDRGSRQPSPRVPRVPRVARGARGAHSRTAPGPAAMTPPARPCPPHAPAPHRQGHRCASIPRRTPAAPRACRSTSRLPCQPCTDRGRYPCRQQGARSTGHRTHWH